MRNIKIIRTLIKFTFLKTYVWFTGHKWIMCYVMVVKLRLLPKFVYEVHFIYFSMSIHVPFYICLKVANSLTSQHWRHSNDCMFIILCEWSATCIFLDIAVCRSAAHWVTSLFGWVRGWAIWLSPNTNLNAPLWSKSRPEISSSSAELLLKIVTKRCASFQLMCNRSVAYLQPAYVHCVEALYLLQ